MNAIYGSNDKKKFLELQQLNHGKLKQNFSMILVGDESFDIYRVNARAEGYKFPAKKKYNGFLGVCEPKTKSFNPTMMIPTITKNWIVTIYGQISNYDSMVEEFGDSATVVGNRSCIVAQTLEKMGKYTDLDVKTVKETLSFIEGNYAAWILNITNKNCFVAKCGEPIYADIYVNDFSTKKFEGAEPLHDGEIYLLTREGMTTVEAFDCSAI